MKNRTVYSGKSNTDSTSKAGSQFNLQVNWGTFL